MKKILLIVFLLFVTHNLFSANNFDEFNKYMSVGDFKSSQKIIKNWGANKLKDPQYYICQYNYYFNKSRSSGIAMKHGEPQQDGIEKFQFSDPKTGKIVGYFAPEVYYDKKIAEIAFTHIKKGIKLFPNHYEMRIGLLWGYKELFQLNDYLYELEDALKFLKISKPKMIYWNNNEIINDPNQFTIETIQGNLNELFQNKNYLKMNEFLLSYCDIMIKYLPNHKYGYSNKGVIYYYLNNNEKALESFLKANKKEKKDERITLNIGLLYFDIGEQEKAKIYFNELIKNGTNQHFRKEAKEKLAIIIQHEKKKTK